MKKIYLLVGLIACSTNVYSQLAEPVVEKDSTSNVWIQFATGPAYYEGGDNAASFFFSFNKRWNQHLMITRLAVFSELFSGYSDVGVMYGYLITLPENTFHVTVSTGLSYVTGQGTSIGLFGGGSSSHNYFNGMGIPYQLSANLKLSKYWGFGATWMGNINRDAVLNGVAVGFQIGDLK